MKCTIIAVHGKDMKDMKDVEDTITNSMIEGVLEAVAELASKGYELWVHHHDAVRKGADEATIKTAAYKIEEHDLAVKLTLGVHIYKTYKHILDGAVTMHMKYRG